MNPASASDTIIQEIAIAGSAERIFDALTNPHERMKWWGAEGRFQVTDFESDLRPGGKWTMRGNGIGGKPFTLTGQYCEIDRPRLLAFTWLPDWYQNAAETLVRWNLEENGGVTTVRLMHSGLTSEESRTSHRGWPQILGWLKAYVEQL
jgi:uncharacterized protein YndB with AHSA1/START domain